MPTRAALILTPTSATKATLAFPSVWPAALFIPFGLERILLRYALPPFPDVFCLANLVLPLSF